MILSKIHKVLEFKQESWLKNYIEQNTIQRTIAKANKNDFLSDFYKLANNSVFGKTMENVRNRCNVSLITDIPNFNDDVNEKCTTVERKLLRHANPKVESVTIFNENLVCVHSHKNIGINE